jgi:hypothetical protein
LMLIIIVRKMKWMIGLVGKVRTSKTVGHLWDVDFRHFSEKFLIVQLFEKSSY